MRKGINVHRFCEGYGIRIRSIHHAREPRPPNVIYGGRTIARLLKRKGPDHAGLVLMCIQASDPSCLYGDTIRAVSEFFKVHEGAIGSRQEARALFRGIDISRLRTRAQRLARMDSEALSSTSSALAVLLAHEIIGEDAA